MAATYHAGELAVQAQAGVQEQARRVGQGIKPTIPPAAQAFLREQPMVLVGSSDAQGQVWASLLSGARGFLMALDERTIQITASPIPGDPLGDNLHDQAAVGLLAIDLASRRRMRVNGTVAVPSTDGFVVHVRQVYANCPKYIQARHLTIDPRAPEKSPVQRADRLSTAQQDWIARGDTFFIASAHPEGGADISHRGGNPGFVWVMDPTTLLLPDYAGNMMFQTLGNLQANPQVGLLLIDFAQGSTLQLTGTARIIWDQERVAEFAGAQRVVEVAIAQAIEIANASPLRSHTVALSPFNPAPPGD